MAAGLGLPGAGVRGILSPRAASGVPHRGPRGRAGLASRDAGGRPMRPCLAPPLCLLLACTPALALTVEPSAPPTQRHDPQRGAAVAPSRDLRGEDGARSLFESTRDVPATRPVPPGPVLPIAPGRSSAAAGDAAAVDAGRRCRGAIAGQAMTPPARPLSAAAGAPRCRAAGGTRPHGSPASSSAWCRARRPPAPARGSPRPARRGRRRPCPPSPAS